MHTFIKKTARLAVALTIPALLLVSCSDDSVEPNQAYDHRKCINPNRPPR